MEKEREETMGVYFHADMGSIMHVHRTGSYCKMENGREKLDTDKKQKKTIPRDREKKKRT